MLALYSAGIAVPWNLTKMAPFKMPNTANLIFQPRVVSQSLCPVTLFQLSIESKVHDLIPAPVWYLLPLTSPL